MKILYLDLNMGAAGDMLAAALLELLPKSEGEDFIHELNHVGVPNVSVSTEKVFRCGISGTHMLVKLHGQEIHEHSHEHAHEHHHEHGHHHTSMHDIEHLISHLNVSDKTKSNILSVYKLIADAESKAHGVAVSEIHFHEVGMMDALADITAVCMLIEKLSPDKIIASPIHVGSGTVKCAHGVMPVPAPATANLLVGIPCYSQDIETELCTPTGAALVKYFADSFGEMPSITVESIGYGCGNKDFHKRANALRAIWGTVNLECSDKIIELCCNTDDMTGEEAGFALEQILEAGAKEAFYQTVFGKKSRPGLMLTVLCDIVTKDSVVQAIFRHTSTIGIRESIKGRYILDRITEVRDTPYGPVSKKVSKGFGVKKEKWEYDELSRIARENGISLSELKSSLN